MKNLVILIILTLFFVQCGKKKNNGLGLGILLLAGGSSSSSSDNVTKSVNPKPGGGGNGGDDPNNAPEFDEVKQKIEKNITFPAGNENKVLSNDFNADFSITGDFFQELGKLEKLSLEHSVSAGSKKTNPTKIDITKQFLTDKKIPLTLNLSPIVPFDTAQGTAWNRFKSSRTGFKPVPTEYIKIMFFCCVNFKHLGR